MILVFDAQKDFFWFHVSLSGFKPRPQTALVIRQCKVNYSYKRILQAFRAVNVIAFIDSSLLCSNNE